MFNTDTKEKFKLAVIVPELNLEDPIVEQLCAVMAEHSFGMIISSEAVTVEQDLSEFKKGRRTPTVLDAIDIATGFITFFTYNISRGKRSTLPIRSLPIKIAHPEVVIATYKQLVIDSKPKR